MAGSDDPERPIHSRQTTAHRLALYVILLAGGILILLISLVIGLADAATRADTSKDVLSAVLPLIASWVGTVLAYYYSRENLDAATRNATEIARGLSGAERLQTLLVTQVMTPPRKIQSMPVTDATKLGDIIAFLKKKGLQRLPIFGDGGAVRYMVHLSTVNDFIGQCALADGHDLAVKDLTFADLLADPARRRTLAESFAAVPETATLADAKAKLSEARGREDVFVTRTGALTEPVLGWITDNNLMSHSRA